MRSVTQLAANFTAQSFLGAAFQRAQTLGNPIVDETRQYAQTKGIGVALHPSSQSPVAIRFKGGKVDSAVIVLTPGQKVIVGQFDEFEWGLPFGWLGGGPVVLYVLHHEDADVSFPDVRSLIVFQRRQVTIAAAITAPGTPNWPLAFPWSAALAGSISQAGSPLFAIDPETVLLNFNGNLGGLPTTLVLAWVNEESFHLNTAVTPPAYTNGNVQAEITFSPSAAAGNVGAVAWLPRELAILGGDSCSFQIIDPTGTFNGTTVDCIRFGRFM